MADYRRENVLEHAVQAFAETIELKVRQLRRLIPKEKQHTNTEITGNYIEEMVRGFIRNWIGEQRLVNGALYNRESAQSGEKALQIDGIVHDPRRGPEVLREGDFEIVHPAFCSGVIEIKMTHASIAGFRDRLTLISHRYMHHLPASRVMGVIIADSDPQRQSELQGSGGAVQHLFNYTTVAWCPVFILFKEHDGDYEPYYPAIDALIRATPQLVIEENFL